MAPTDSFQSTSSENDFLSRYDEKEATASLLPPSMAADSWDDGQLEESASRRQKRHWSITRRRMALLVLGAIVLVGGFAGTRRKTAEPAAEVVEGVEREMEGIAVNATTEEIRVQGFDTSLVLNNPFPQATFAMQLKPGVRYITSIGFGGHSNQFIGVVKLIYLAQLTNRVAIVPTLTPLHFMGGPEKVSEFYDLDRFYSATAIPVVDFSAFKSVELSARRDDRISCWSVQEVTPTGGANRAADSMSVHSVGVDFWALPRDMARGLGGNDLSYDSIRLFDFNVWARRMWVETVKKQFLPQVAVPIATNLRKARPVFKADPSKTMKGGFSPLTTAPPTDQLMCLDNSLFLGPVMFEPAFAPAIPDEPGVAGEGLSWIAVGQHLRFATQVDEVVDEYLLNLFSVERAVDIPPFITVHLRRTDFISFTGLTPLEKYTLALDRVISKMQDRLDNLDTWRGPGKANWEAAEFDKTIPIKDYQIVATTDEPAGSEFIEHVRDLGWYVLSHEELLTTEVLGGWWPTILDSAILARGRAFVGTPSSTYSHLAGLRVKYWQGGIVESAT